MHTLRRRLTYTHTAVGLLAVLLMALLASGLIVRAYGQLAAQQAQTIRQNQARVLALFYARNHGWNGLPDALQQRLADQPAANQRRIVVADANERVLFDSSGALDAKPLPARLQAQSSPVIAGGKTVGFVAVPVGGGDRTEQDRAFGNAIFAIVLVGGVGSAAAALVVALLLARQVTTPLRSLTRAAHRLAAGERFEPIAQPADAELAELATAFNIMAGEIDQQQRLRRQLVADIAHELRTPLSVLRMQIESVQDGIEQPTPSVLASLAEEVDLLSRLVDDLRLLSLADAGQLSFAAEPLEPWSAVERAATAAAPRARQHGISLRVAAAHDLPMILADPQRLQQVLGNLLDNALRYTPPGGSITCGAALDRTAGAAEAAITLSIADTGAGIAPNDLPHVFDRFYRTDVARSRETGGSGLGLAIVQRLVEAQGGSVHVDSILGRGSTFRVVLPVAQHMLKRADK